MLYPVKEAAEYIGIHWLYFEFLHKRYDYEHTVKKVRRPLRLWSSETLDQVLIDIKSGKHTQDIIDYKEEVALYQRIQRLKRAGKEINEENLKFKKRGPRIPKEEVYTDEDLDNWDYIPHLILHIIKQTDDEYKVIYQQTPDSESITTIDTLEEVKNKINKL